MTTQRIIFLGGSALALVGYIICVIGLATTSQAHATPTPYRLVSFGVVGMLSTTLALVLCFARGAQVGDQN